MTLKALFSRGRLGVGVELGRPGIGSYFRDVEIVSMALMGADIGYKLADENPVTHFMSDKKTGKLRDDVLGEKATSAIIEGKCKLERLPEALKALEEAAKKVDTVFTVEVITKVTQEGEKYPSKRSWKKQVTGIQSTAKTIWGWENRPSNFTITRGG